jgi:mono/diheme cytochrome c family protein
MRYSAVIFFQFASLASLARAADVEFNRDILPILSDKCFTCHGPDAAAKKIPFRLDSEAAAKADLGGGKTAIREGNPQASELIRRITTESKAQLMPPVYTGSTLSTAEIQKLTQWVSDGAKWQQHWSFIPPRATDPPAPTKPDWVRNPIDNFVLARLNQEGLSPSPETDKETLIRRVTLDLTGLPPTPAETAQFLQDSSPQAYERVVDRLLASPRYGERMATPWLDAARYADSNGYQYDGERIMWPWRDWVIRAFNQNKPFDQFTVEQIAGDLLPNATSDQRIATGFNRNHRMNTEDGIIAEEYAAEYVVDRVDATSTVFLGLTLACARCHNHKYDPFTQKEFYQVFAYFDNIPELGRAMKYGNSPPLELAPTDQQKQRLTALDQRLTQLSHFIAENDLKIAQSQTAWERSLPGEDRDHWAPQAGIQKGCSIEAGPASADVQQVPGVFRTASKFSGASYLDRGDVCGFDIQDRFTIAAWVLDGEGPLATRMEDKGEGKGYAFAIEDGRVRVNLTSIWVDDAVKVKTEEKLAPGKWHHVAMTYDGSRTAGGVKVYVDGASAQLKVEQDNLYRPFRNAGKPVKDPLRIGGGWGPAKRFRGSMEDVRVYDDALPAMEISALAVPESISAIAAKPVADRTGIEKYLLRRFYLEDAAPAEWKSQWQAKLDLERQRQELVRTFPTVMVMAEKPKRDDTFILIRGAYNVRGDKVEPGVPAVLPPLPPGAPTNRLGFAEWLVDKKNPLLARVTVNRFWQMYFGTGIVKTTEDFGRQGEWPSHPELLDWLAVQFMQTGWDVKAMQKLIVMSATYRQASEVTPALQNRDPDNRLLARGPRFRLTAGMIRDQALFAAGLLSEKIGGPSVKPYQPDGLWKELSMQDMDYVQSHGDDLHRRTLYTFWKRTVAPPMQANFDSALRESCVVRETRTNTPLQALNLMNDVTFLEAARLLGQRMIKEGGTTAAEHLSYGFRLLNGRAPRPEEQEVLREDLQYHLDYFSTNPKEVELYLKQGETPVDPALNPREIAAYAAVGSLLLNLDETVTKE